MHLSGRTSSAATVLLAAALGCGGLAGCRSTEAEPRPAVVAPQPELEVATYRHDVAFAPGSALLTTGARQSLQAFLADAGVSPSDRVFVTAAAAPSAPHLAEQRRRAVAGALSADGISAEPYPAAHGDPAAAAAAVVVRRSVVRLPPCPDWTQRPNRDGDNQPIRNWGCATAVNFGMMLADPEDLARGREPGPADGEALARSIARYREGKTQPLIRDITSGELFPASNGGAGSSEPAAQ